jgi:hypothetical protein
VSTDYSRRRKSPPKPRTGNSPRAKGPTRTGNSPRAKPKAKPRPSIKTGNTGSKARQVTYARTHDQDVRTGSTAANPFNITKREYRSAVAKKKYLKSTTHQGAAIRKAMGKAKSGAKKPAMAPWTPYRGK